MPGEVIQDTYKPFFSDFLYRCVKIFSIAVPVLFFVTVLYGQTPLPPPTSLQVFTAQELGFGSFITGSSGGTVVISPQGTRTVTGTVTGLALDTGSPALFDVRLAQGRMVHILFPATAILTRTGGGETMYITGFTSDKQGNNFVTSAAHPFVNPVKTGATLHVGNISENPSGSYIGTFTVTFVQE